MRRKLPCSSATIWLLFASCFLAPAESHAVPQEDWQSQFGNLNFGTDEDDTPPYQLNGSFSVDKGTRNGTLNIKLKIKEGWHGYSQKKLNGQAPTVFDVKGTPQFKVVGPFTPDKKPKAGQNSLGDMEEFDGTVVWAAPIELAENVVAESLIIEVDVLGQVCSQNCVPFEGDQAKVRAAFSGYNQSVDAFFSPHGKIKGSFNKSKIEPGDSFTLTITAELEKDWHIYRFEEFKKQGTTPQPTIIYFTKSADFQVRTPVPSKEPIKHEINLKDEPFSYYHEGKTQWAIDIAAPKDLDTGKYNLEGRMFFQMCTEDSCDEPTALSFRLPIEIGSESKDAENTISIAVSNEKPEELMRQSKEFWETQRKSKRAVLAFNELAIYLVAAFFAGLILNAMPCVLPVIGLKVMSFVQQAGENRSRIFLLNLVFSLGLLVVFWVLATLSAFFGYGWGDVLTKSFSGLVIVTSIVFAFGLSMLGVWEIPIPGLSGGGGISKKSEEEGLLGAFLLGILTTILATPCTGPFLATALTITAGQPPWVAYLIFTFIGLGMAIPYLLVGIFPSLIGWLPRPGMWMTTFKQITGFILMGAVVFLMSSFSFEPRNVYLVAMMSLLLCIAVGCWWIGQTSLAAEASEQRKAWGIGLGIIAAGSFVAFTFFVPSPYELDWEDYSRKRLAELRAENRLVFIDFTGPG